MAAVWAANWAAEDAWRAELVPLMLFGMTMAIVYRQEVALLLSGVLALGRRLGRRAQPGGIRHLARRHRRGSVNLGRIRSRSKLIYVGLAAGCVAAVLDIATQRHRQPAHRPAAAERRRLDRRCGPWPPASS